MKILASTLVASALLLGSQVAMAQPDRGDHGRHEQGRDHGHGDERHDRGHDERHYGMTAYDHAPLRS